MLLSAHSYLVMEGWRGPTAPSVISSWINVGYAILCLLAFWHEESAIARLKQPLSMEVSGETLVNRNPTSWFSRFVYCSSWGHSIVYQPLVQCIRAPWRAESKSFNICPLSWHLIWAFNCHPFILYSWPIKTTPCDFPCSFLFRLFAVKQQSAFRRHMLNVAKPHDGRNWKRHMKEISYHLGISILGFIWAINKLVF